MRIHLIGIGGTAMTALARLLGDLGHTVTGSDVGVYPPMSDELERMGICPRTPYSSDLPDPTPELVVVGNAIPRGNPELEAVLDRGLAYTSQAEAIEDLVLPGRTPVVVAGTHGKTTTTSLIAWTLRVADRDPGWLIGGVPLDLPAPAALGGGAEIVIEGDEYDTAYFDKRPKFHHYRPRLLIVGNLEHDHADIYPDLEAIALEFRRLVNTVPRTGLIAVGAESPAALEVTRAAHCPVVTYGLDPDLDLAAIDLITSADGTRFDVLRSGRPLGQFQLGICGTHNVRNALAALAVALHLEVPLDRIQKAFAGFRGVRRRLEALGEARGVTLFDDFAHHPTAIAATLETLRARGLSGRLWAVLEPRSWSMRRNLHQETLPTALAGADCVALLPVFQPDRLAAAERLDTERVIRELAGRGVDAHAVADVSAAIALLVERTRPGDVLVFMSNGGFDGIQGRLLAALDTAK